MNGLFNMIQEHLGKNLLMANGKCPESCYECCSLTVGTNIMNFRKLKRILKPIHLEKYYSDNEKLWWTCPFLIDGKCSIYHNASKPKICSAYVCSAEYFLNNNPKSLFAVKNDDKKILFELLPKELQEKIVKNKRVEHILAKRNMLMNEKER